MNKHTAISRILAGIVDFLMVGSIVALFMIPAVISLATTLTNDIEINVIALFITSFLGGALSLIGIIIYTVLIPVYWKGQTLGKRIFYLQIKKKNGEDVDFKAMFGRVLLRIMMVLITLGLSIIVDFITLCSLKEHNTFYDILASTCVKEART